MKQIIFVLAMVTAIACTKQQVPEGYTTHTTEVNSDYPENKEVAALIAPYKQGLEAEMNTVIGEFGHEMYKRRPESSLGNFMCDAPLYIYNNSVEAAQRADICFMNYGGIRAQHIPEGPVTVNNMFELMPFENEAVILEMTGEPLRSFLNKTAESGGWPVSNGVEMIIENDMVQEMTIDGLPVDYSKTYRILLSDYIANGGDGMSMLTGLPREDSGIKVRDMLLEYCKEITRTGKKINAEIDGRVIVRN